MKREISIARRAELDLTRQYAWYFQRAGTDVAERYLVFIDEMISKLSEIPSLGRRRRFRSPELAGIHSKTAAAPFGVHLIFYRFDQSHLSIERIIHGARDLERRLSEEPEK